MYAALCGLVPDLCAANMSPTCSLCTGVNGQYCAALAGMFLINQRSPKGTWNEPNIIYMTVFPRRLCEHAGVKPVHCGFRWKHMVVVLGRVGLVMVVGKMPTQGNTKHIKHCPYRRRHDPECRGKISALTILHHNDRQMCDGRKPSKYWCNISAWL